MTRTFAKALLAASLTAMASTTVADGKPQAAPEAGTWRFNVFLDDRRIGYHTFEVSEEAGEQNVRSEARFEVEILFVTAYRYVHDNQEHWRGNCLQRISASTNDNGDRFVVEGRQDGEAFDVRLNEQLTTLDKSCVQSFAYWNPVLLQSGRLLNAQNGEFRDVELRHVGRAPFDVGDRTVSADEYVLATSDGDIRLWYETGAQRWLGLETSARGDRRLRYVPEQVPGLDSSSPRVSVTASAGSGPVVLP